MKKELAAIVKFVEDLAAEEICEDFDSREPPCTLDSGPYCGTHPYEDDIRKDARRLIADWKTYDVVKP